MRDVSWPGLALLALLTGAGALVMDRLGRANPWFMGAMLVSMAVTMAGLHLSAVPASGGRRRAAGDRCQPGRALSRGISAHGAALAGVSGRRHVRFDGDLRSVCRRTGMGRGLPWVTLLLGTSPAVSPRWPSRPRCFSWACPWSLRSRVPADCRADAGWGRCSGRIYPPSEGGSAT